MARRESLRGHEVFLMAFLSPETSPASVSTRWWCFSDPDVTCLRRKPLKTEVSLSLVYHTHTLSPEKLWPNMHLWSVKRCNPDPASHQPKTWVSFLCRDPTPSLMFHGWETDLDLCLCLRIFLTVFIFLMFCGFWRGCPWNFLRRIGNPKALLFRCRIVSFRWLAGRFFCCKSIILILYPV